MDKFYRFFFWAITVLVLGGLPIIGIQMLYATNQHPAPEAATVWGICSLIAGLSLAGLIAYLLKTGSPWVKNVVLSGLVFVVGWVVLEAVCGLILHWRADTNVVKTAPNVVQNGSIQIRQRNMQLLVYDSLGINRLQPGTYQSIYTDQRSAGPKNVVITYHIDSLSRRITPFNSQRAVGRYALFLGCSFTYGEAVPDSATLPYFFGQQTGYRPYNYGVSGYSPAHVLALMQTINLRHEVAEKDGVAFYTYIDDHLARTTPSTRWIYNADGYLPSVNPDNERVEGTYAAKHPARLTMIRWMYASNVAQLFRLNFPLRYSTEHYRRFVAIVRKLKDLYRQQFGNDNFYVVIFPAYPLAPELRQLFGQAGLKLLDYSALPMWATTYDGMHPDGLAYQQVARHMAHDVVGAGQPMPVPVDSSVGQ